MTGFNPIEMWRNFALITSIVIIHSVFGGIGVLIMIIGLVLIDLIRNEMLYTYTDSKTRIVKKTGQLQKYYKFDGFSTVPSSARWVNIRKEGDDTDAVD